MIFKKESHWVRVRREKKWHKWFAWRPIRLDDHHVVWLQYIERRRHERFFDVFEYRVIRDKTKSEDFL